MRCTLCGFPFGLSLPEARSTLGLSWRRISTVASTVSVSDASDILCTTAGLDTEVNQHQRIFDDIEANGVDANNVPAIDSKIYIAALTADMQIDAQGVQVGHMENYVQSGLQRC